MRIAVISLLVLVAAGLAVYPMFDTTRRGRNPWPWIIGGLFLGPIAGVVYLMTLHSQRAVALRHEEVSGD